MIKEENLVFIDDYAHHPVEIEAFLKSVRSLYPAKKITVIFQPHLYSRTRDFADGFANSLSLADDLILLEIYPAREAPIPGINSSIIIEKVKLPSKSLVANSELIEELAKRDIEILCTMGAGDIDKMVDEISSHLKSRSE